MGKSLSVQRGGHIPLLVGEGNELKRAVVHRKVLQHPFFAGLLELAAMEFGHDQRGVLRIPCDISCFHRIVQLIRIRRRKRRRKVMVSILLFLKLM